MMQHGIIQPPAGAGHMTQHGPGNLRPELVSPTGRPNSAGTYIRGSVVERLSCSPSTSGVRISAWVHHVGKLVVTCRCLVCCNTQ